MLGQSQDIQRKIKDQVRRRDRYQCVVCGLDDFVHNRRYGQALDVHRIIHGSNYSTKRGVCVTLCQVCHDAMHKKGNWSWVLTSENDYTGTGSIKLKWALRYDIAQEREWQRRAAWGSLLRKLRIERGFKRPEVLAIHANLGHKDVENFEEGRREPTLFELKALAEVLKVSLDELFHEEEPSEDGWLPDCEKRSQLRAITFRTRDLREGEELLTPEAKYLSQVVQNKCDQRAEVEAAAEAAWAEECRLKAIMRRSFAPGGVELKFDR